MSQILCTVVPVLHGILALVMQSLPFEILSNEQAEHGIACEYSLRESASAIYSKKFHAAEVYHPSLISNNYNNMHMKPKKNKRC